MIPVPNITLQGTELHKALGIGATRRRQLKQLSQGRNVAPLDVWTIGHVAVGALLGLVGASRSTAYGVVVGTEVFEAIARGSGIQFFDESRQNILADLVTGIVSYELGRAAK